MNICYSGAAVGADTVFGEFALRADHQVVHFVHEKDPRRIHWSGYTKILSPAELYQADEPLVQASKILNRKFPTGKSYVDNLLRRNFYQIKDTERVYAIAPIDEDQKRVKGGTGWAVQMAIDRGVPEIYLFDLSSNKWYTRIVRSEWAYAYFAEIFSPPKPHGRYTGIGSRELTPEGVEAIRKLYE